MLDVWNRVLTNIKIAVSDVCTTVSNTETDDPASFPAIFVTQMENRDAETDMENTEFGVISEIRIQCYSRHSLAESRSIMATACDAMRVMGYRRTLGPREILNVSDRNVKRTEARFRRFVGDLTDIPKFEINNNNT